MKTIKVFMAILSSIGLFFGCAKAETSSLENAPEAVTPQEFQSRLKNDTSAYLLDVRRPEEFNSGHLAGANLLNWLDSTAFASGSEKLDKTKKIYVYCRSGRRSAEAALFLASRGFIVVDMKGGYTAWTGAGLPTEK